MTDLRVPPLTSSPSHPLWIYRTIPLDATRNRSNSKEEQHSAHLPRYLPSPACRNSQDLSPPNSPTIPRSSPVHLKGFQDSPPPKRRQSPCSPRPKPQRPSDFSIDHILRYAGPKPTSPPPPTLQLFDWLHCTRYHPPRLHREYFYE